MDKERSVNLCSKYVLPLLGLSRHSFDSFGASRFINSYVSQDDMYIVVECTHPFSAVITNHANYCFCLKKDKNYLAVFEVPVYYREDVVKFRKGAYSKLSDAAKNLIKKKSGLTYRQPAKGGKYNTAIELLALDKDPVLREYWEEKIGERLPPDAELFSIPDETNFYELDITTNIETANV